MELKIQFVCPECDESILLTVGQLAPGHRKTCSNCQAPGELTPDTLTRFRQDLRHYCEA